MNQIRQIRSVCCDVKSPSMRRSGIWVGPRLLLATLHIQDWGQRITFERGMSAPSGKVDSFFPPPESEIPFASLVSEHSPKSYSYSPVIARRMTWRFFRLQDSYPSTIGLGAPPSFFSGTRRYRIWCFGTCMIKAPRSRCGMKERGSFQFFYAPDRRKWIEDTYEIEGRQFKAKLLLT